MRKELFWALSNVTASSSDIIDQCMQMGILSRAMFHFFNDVPAIKREVAMVLYNVLEKGTH